MKFFSVSKFEKAKYIPRNVYQLSKFYPEFEYSVIVPGHEISLFEDYFSRLNIHNINIIDESKYISLDSFISILENYIEKSSSKMPARNMVGWYYQLVLKIAHVINHNENEGITMLDADLVLLKKLNLFKNNHSIVYKTNYEKNIHYQKSCKDILGIKEKKWESFTIQTFSITKEESIDLFTRLNKYMSQDSMNYGEWISHLLLKSVFKRNSGINGNYMSEQDLIGNSNLMSGAKINRSLKILRSFVLGELSPRQEKIAAFFGYSFVNYETWIMKKEKLNYLDFLITLIINTHIIHKIFKKFQSLNKKLQ